MPTDICTAPATITLGERYQVGLEKASTFALQAIKVSRDEYEFLILEDLLSNAPFFMAHQGFWSKVP
jgi:hypothetical protein